MTLCPKDKLLIEGVQRYATKLVPGLKDHDYSETERLNSMYLPSMKYYRERGDMTERIQGLSSVNNNLLKMDIIY